MKLIGVDQGIFDLSDDSAYSRFTDTIGLSYMKLRSVFSFQFALARVRIYRIQFHILMTALTDFETNKYYYAQQPIFFGRNIIITQE
jgi:hypothetical protein